MTGALGKSVCNFCERIVVEGEGLRLRKYGSDSIEVRVQVDEWY